MAECLLELNGAKVDLELPAAKSLLGVVAASSEAMAGAAGLGRHASLRTRLIAEEIFLHICGSCGPNSTQSELKIQFTPLPDGLEISFLSRYLTYDPQDLPDYSIESLLKDENPSGLGLHLVKSYASKISLVKRGLQRELTILMARGQDEAGSRPWSRLIPSLAQGVKLTPMEHQGKLVRRLDAGPGGKSYLVRALAWQVLGLIDGQNSFARIMAKTLQVMPERSRHQVEDLFEALIQRNIVTTRELPRPEAEVVITKDDTDAPRRPGHKGLPGLSDQARG